MKGATPDHLIGIDKALAAAAVLGWPGGASVCGTCRPGAARLLAVETSLAALPPRSRPQRRTPSPGHGPAFRTRTPAAAVLFTSGSTGPAKGVVYTHGQLAAIARCRWPRRSAIRPGARLVAGFAPFALLGPGARRRFGDARHGRHRRRAPSRASALAARRGGRRRHGGLRRPRPRSQRRRHARPT